MKKNIIPLLTVAFLVAVASTVVFYGLFVGRLGSATTPSGQHSIVIAAHALPPGTVVAKTDLGSLQWSGPLLPKGSFSDPEQVTGKTVFAPIAEGEPIFESRLVSKSGDGVGVPSGLRAVSVHVSDSSGVVGVLRPGHKVDVQVFVANPSGNSVPEFRTVLQDIAVLSVTPVAEPLARGGNVPTVTLLATPKQADVLGLADSYARVRLSLRNPLDGGTESRPAMGLSSLFRGSSYETRSTEKSGVAAPQTTRSSSNSVSVTVQLLAASRPAFDELAAQFGLEGRPEMFQTSAPKPDSDAQALMEKLKEQKGLEVLSTARVVASPHRDASVEVGSEGRPGATDSIGLRIRFEPFFAQQQLRLRVAPEVSAPQSGRTSLRRLDTQIDVTRGSAVLLLGMMDARERALLFAGGDQASGERQVVALITPHFSETDRKAAAGH